MDGSSHHKLYQIITDGYDIFKYSTDDNMTVQTKINESTETWPNDIWDSYEKQIKERQVNLRQISASIEQKVTTYDSYIRSTIKTWFKKN